MPRTWISPHAIGRRRSPVVAIGVAALMAPTWLAGASPILAHENEVIRFGSFLGGMTHPVLGPDHLLAMLKNAQSSARIYRQKFIDCDTKNTCKWTSVSAGYKTDCDVETETRVTGDSDMLMIFCPFCGG